MNDYIYHGIRAGDKVFVTLWEGQVVQEGTALGPVNPADMTVVVCLEGIEGLTKPRVSTIPEYKVRIAEDWLSREE